jgi:SAM-dependent methyltransferase
MHSRRLAAIYDRHWRPAFMTAAIGSRLDPEREAARIERWLAPARGGDVIDLSCGPGLIGRRLARSGGFRRVFGADLSGAMLDVCARECAREAAPMVLVRADVGRLPFASGSIAGIHAGAALHMWPDPAAAVAEAGRVLAPGGVFVASTFIHRHAGPGRALASLAMATLERRMAVRVFELSELRGYCHDAGLADVDARPRGNWVWLRAVRSDAPAIRAPGCRSRPDSASWGTVPG